MRKLVLHVGCHKTGTSAIQKNLSLNKSELESQGWFLLSPRRPFRRFHLMGNANSYFSISEVDGIIKVNINKRFYSDLKKSKGNVIVSAEELSWLFEREDISNLKERLSEIFCDIKVIVYFRRQDKHLLSHYQQGFRFYESSAAKFYGRDSITPPGYHNYFENYFNYNTKSLCWSEFFGDESVVVRWFDKSLLCNGDSTADFSQATGIKILAKEKTNNEAMTLEELILSKLLFEKYTNNYYLINYYKSKITLERKTKILADKDSMISFYRHFHESNLNLIERKFKDENYKTLVRETLTDFSYYDPYDASLYLMLENSIKSKLGKVKKCSVILVVLFYIASRIRIILRKIIK